MARRAKTSREQAPLDATRWTYLDLIRRRPGTRFTVLWKILGSNRGTARYHLSVLERVGAIRTVRVGRSTRYFSADLDPTEVAEMALLLRGRVLEVATAILHRPGVLQRDLVAGLRISRKVFRSYADLLTARGLVDERLDARRKRYHPTERLAKALGRMKNGDAR